MHRPMATMIWHVFTRAARMQCLAAKCHNVLHPAELLSSASDVMLSTA